MHLFNPDSKIMKLSIFSSFFPQLSLQVQLPSGNYKVAGTIFSSGLFQFISYVSNKHLPASLFLSL